MSDEADSDEIPAEFEITDSLDLHTFRPQDVGELVADYLELAVERRYASVRIIHGKGIGNLRRTVHAVLDRSAFVKSYRLGDESSGSWGATVVELKLP